MAFPSKGLNLLVHGVLGTMAKVLVEEAQKSRCHWFPYTNGGIAKRRVAKNSPIRCQTAN